ncbi:Peroxisomal membrane mpv17 pmp22-like protein, partial [Globisporangium splendens]
MMLHLRALSMRAVPSIGRSSIVVPTAARCTVTSQHRQFVSKVPTSSSSSANENVFKRAWAKYNTLLQTHPVSTKIVTGSAIAAIGDINCQAFLEPDTRFSVKRVMIFTFLGGVFISPILHVWYGFLGRVVPGTTNAAIAKRLALDQLGFAPTFLPIFFTVLLTLEGNVDKVPEKLKKDWWSAVKTNWGVWVPAQLINFRFVPGSLQVLFSNVVGLFWNSYLSYISHSDAHAPAALESETEPVAEPVSLAN